MLRYLDGPGQESDPDRHDDDLIPQPDPSEVDDLDFGPAVDGDEPLDAVRVGDQDDQTDMLKQKIVGLEHRIGYLERIVKVSQMLNSTLSLEPLLQIIVQSATELTNTEACSIMLIDRNTGELRFAEASGGVSSALRKISIPMDKSIAGYVIRKNKPILIRDAKNDPRWHGDVDTTLDFQTQSILGVPLRVRDRVIGVLEVINKTTSEGFNEDDIQITTTLGLQAAIAIENARLLDELQQAYRDLSQVDQLKNDFVSIASHELRTPLAVILGYATFLKDNVKGEASEQLDIVLSSAIKLRALIDDMVNLRHIQTDGVQLERSIFSLKSLVNDVTKEFSQIIATKKLILTTKFSPEDSLLNIDGDRQKVYLIVANLVSNAIKFTPEGGRIHVSVHFNDHKYTLSVIDTGIGIPKAEYDRIFDQFYQVEPPLTRKYQGMGLGLSIAKGMVQVHRGRIWVESVVGKGSKFVVVLPSAPDVRDE
ncbi:MAG: Sensor histidine kinase RcsC [Anaerolineae bacterium]|nr:Sensor histidine kinase RcsC [Anaerolineae bacterium]